MRFCDKLPKLRKDNNLSQEQLADRLSVSRQAVSKWESGNSYPDMDKMIQMCNILNCTLEDILDDGVIGNSSSNKNNVNNYFQDFLKFITKVYNMFCSMSFKEKLKCLFEMGIIFLILFCLGAIIFNIIDSLLIDLFLNIPKIGHVFSVIFSNILITVLVAIGLIIFIHLFKVRYLDYYITVEDNNAVCKSIEIPVDKGKKEYYNDIKKEKIIIRDPKHSSFSFFNFLLKIILFGLKVMAMFIAVFVIIAFVLLVISLVIVISYFGDGVLFVYFAIFLIGMLIVSYNILEIIYRFIVSKGQAIKRIFVMFIVAFTLIGIGIGLSLKTVMSFEMMNEFYDNDYLSTFEEIEMQDNMVIDFYTAFDSVQFAIDNSIDNIKIEIKYLDGITYYLNGENNYYYLDYNFNFKYAYNLLLNDLRNKRIRDYDSSSFIKITVTLSQENYDKISSNYKRNFLNGDY